MAIYAISDLHLALSIDKPMDVFGERWRGYMERLKTEWEQTVAAEDHVVIPGDVSWATYVEQALDDFRFINELPGKKIILKGNHDYWWTTISKLKKFLAGNGFDSIDFLHNDSCVIGDVSVCGTRGWKCPGDEDFSEEDAKIYRRELERLGLSLKKAAHAGEVRFIVAALHYPPFNAKREPSGFVEIMRRYGVKLCIYGHLHSGCVNGAVEGEHYGMDFKLVSADYLGFRPVLIHAQERAGFNI